MQAEGLRVLLRAPGQGGVVGDVDVAGIGLAGAIEGVDSGAREGHVGIVCRRVGGRWVGHIVLQQEHIPMDFSASITTVQGHPPTNFLTLVLSILERLRKGRLQAHFPKLIWSTVWGPL